MLTAPIPANETERLADLHALRILDTPPEQRFDGIVRLARLTFNVPIAYIAFVDSERQWFKAKSGLTVDSTGRDVSFCGHAILQKEPTVIPDASLDPRFSDNPLVVGEPRIRFYAGHPLRGRSGTNVGTLCLADRVPRTLDANQLAVFGQLARLVEEQLQMVDLIETQRELLETRAALEETQRRLEKELVEASQYVQSLLPEPLDGDLRTDWKYISSSQLGGDLFGYHWLDDRHWALYLLDACGHGVGASLLSISAHTALRRRTLPATDFEDPGSVLTALNRAFPMDEHNGKFFTIWYGVYDAQDRVLRYASAGHPPVVLANGAPRLERLDAASLMIGVVPELSYTTLEHPLSPGTRLYLFSDGAFEIAAPGGPMLLLDGLIGLLEAESGSPGSRVSRVLERLQEIQGSPDFADDFSLLEVEFG